MVGEEADLYSIFGDRVQDEDGRDSCCMIVTGDEGEVDGGGSINTEHLHGHPL